MIRKTKTVETFTRFALTTRKVPKPFEKPAEKTSKILKRFEKFVGRNRDPEASIRGVKS